MRAAPIGVFPSVAEVIRRAEIQARITHNTPEGTGAAVAAALMAHYTLYRLGPRREIGEFLASHLPGEWAKPWQGKVGSKGTMSVRAAATALAQATSMQDLLRRCVAFTGDTDTTAAIALSAGSCASDLAQDLPASLLDRLEDGPFGRAYLLDLDRRLLSRAGRRSG